MLPAVARWRPSPAVLALALGVAIGRPGLRLVEPRLAQDGGLLEVLSQLALLASLFCVGLRIQMPFSWSRWRIPTRLATLSMLATLILASAAAMLLFGVNFLEALLIAGILAPTDPVLGPEAVAEPQAAEAHSVEGSLNSALALALIAVVLGLMGLETGADGTTAAAPAWLASRALWWLLGGAAIGWLIGLGMARWIALMDFDRQTARFETTLETIVVFATSVLAFAGAEVLHAGGVPAVFVAAVALSHGGRFRAPVRRRPMGRRVLKIAGRVEKLAVLASIVLLGVLSSEMDFRLKIVAFALLLLGLIRPLAVRLGLADLQSAAPQRRSLEWAGIRGTASLYGLVFAINHGVSGPFARQLAGIVLFVIAGSIVLHGAAATPVQRASPGALSS